MLSSAHRSRNGNRPGHSTVVGKRKKPASGNPKGSSDSSASAPSADRLQAATSIGRPKLETRILNELRPFPEQAAYFDPLSEHEMAALARDIDHHGLRFPIEVMPSNAAGLPENTIVKGHQRRRALLFNGETKTTVLVRYDLVDADIAIIEEEFLADNQYRRQLDKLSKARVAMRLLEIERKRSRRRADDEEAEARDRVGKAIGMSGRNLARYMKLLRTPREVQDAFRANKISLVVAEKVADLEPDKQEEVARRIRDGEEPKAVLADFLPRKKEKQKQSADYVKDFVASLARNVKTLQPRLKKIRPGDVRGHAEELRRAKEVIEKLLRLAQE